MNRRTAILIAVLLALTPAYGDGIYNGGGSSGGSGFGPLATGCQATGGTIPKNGSGAISTQTVINDLSGSNPTITASYCGQLENLDNASAQTSTVAVSGSTGFPQSWYTDLCNINTGAQTLTPASGTIGGASTYVLAAGTKAAPNCVRIISDAANTNYVVEFPPGSSSSGANPTATAGPNANNGSATTFMRSDASPAVQVGSASQQGILQVGSSLGVAAGIVSNPLPAIPSYYISGNWYTPFGLISQNTGASQTTNTIYCFYGGVFKSVTIKALGVYLITGVGTDTLQIAVYSENSGTLSLVDNTANIAAGTAQSASAINGAVGNGTDTLSPGVEYAFCTNTNGSAATLTALNPGALSQAQYVGSSTQVHVTSPSSSVAFLTGRSISQTYTSSGTAAGADWPSTITESSMSDVSPSASSPVGIIGFQVN